MVDYLIFFKFQLGLINTVRMISLTPMIVFIETIDEKLICTTLKVATVIAGGMACIALVFSGDIFTGTVYNLVTRNKIPQGLFSGSNKTFVQMMLFSDNLC